MNIWYNFEDVKNALGTWTLPEIPFWYNNKKWNNRLRNEHIPKKEENTYSNTSSNIQRNMKKKKGAPRQHQNGPTRTLNQNRNYDQDRGYEYRREDSDQHLQYDQDDYHYQSDYNWKWEKGRALRDHYAEPNQPRFYEA